MTTSTKQNLPVITIRWQAPGLPTPATTEVRPDGDGGMEVRYLHDLDNPDWQPLGSEPDDDDDRRILLEAHATLLEFHFGGPIKREALTTH
jgi:hypothetical protein